MLRLLSVGGFGRRRAITQSPPVADVTLTFDVVANQPPAAVDITLTYDVEPS